MNNFKKCALTAALLMGMGVSAGAMAANATVVWSGIVPTSNASDTLVITGFAGDMSALTGTISADSDGVFTSDSIVLEAHVNDSDDADAPTVGVLTLANWTLTDATVSYDGIANPAQVVTVEINGAPATVGEDIASVDTISTKVSQTAVLPASEVGGASVQASLSVLASII
ncbi:hypothetical protein [Vibrio apostichopi]|uniref:hypothetical protein n=1 Tax=Vibrio apostichopi TaxID=3035453 RepID=UPI002573B76E|nr:hypothetical protein [Vibrio sp. FE10]